MTETNRTMHPIARRALLATAAATLTTIATGAHAGAATPTTCMLTVQPFDDISRRLEVDYADGSHRVLLGVQDNRTTLGGPRTFELDASVRRINWAWNRAAGTWRTSLAVAPGCAMEAYPYWTHGEHQPSLAMTVGQVPTTTTVAPATTTTAQPPTSTTRPAVTTTTAPTPTSTTAVTPGATTTTGPQPFTVQRVTPIPVACAPDACQPALVRPPAQRLPETGRQTWPQVRMAIGLALAGLCAMAIAKVMQQDEDINNEEGNG